MKRLQILRFQLRNSIQTYTLNQQTGDYIDTNGVKYHLYTFFGKDVCITSILDKHRSKTFSVGDKITTPQGPKEIISMKVVNSAETVNVQFTLLTNNAANTILMSNTTLYVEPKPTVKVKATINGQHPEFYTLEQRILKDFDNKTLKFDVFKRKKTETFEEFKNLFWTRNTEFRTIWSDSSYEQTTIGRRRSLGDIFMICKYYYPTISLETIIRWLYGKDTPGGRYCGGVHKRVFRYDYRGVFHNLTYKDEYGNLITFYTEKIK